MARRRFAGNADHLIVYQKGERWHVNVPPHGVARFDVETIARFDSDLAPRFVVKEERCRTVPSGGVGLRTTGHAGANQFGGAKGRR